MEGKRKGEEKEVSTEASPKLVNHHVTHLNIFAAQQGSNETQPSCLREEIIVFIVPYLRWGLES